MLRRAVFVVFLACAAAWPAAASAPAAATETVSFAVTVQGTQRTVITATRRSVDDLGCSVTRMDSDRRTLVFSTRAPGRVAVSVPGGPALARVPVVVTASGIRHSTRRVAGEAPECEVAPQASESRCGPLPLAGTAIVRLPAPGRVLLAGSLARRRDAARCAPSAGRAQPFLVSSQGRFPAAHLTDARAARIILRGSARFTDRLANGATRVTTVRWTVVLRRRS